jgi:hypothetical protein
MDAWLPDVHIKVEVQEEEEDCTAVSVISSMYHELFLISDHS